MRAIFFAKHFREGKDCYKRFRDNYDDFKRNLKSHTAAIQKSYKLLGKIDGFVTSKTRKKHFDHIDFAHNVQSFVRPPTFYSQERKIITVDSLIAVLKDAQDIISTYKKELDHCVSEQKRGFNRADKHQQDIADLSKNIDHILKIIIYNKDIFEHALREFNIRVARRKSLIRIRDKDIPRLERLYNADYAKHFRTQNLIGNSEEAKKLEIAKRQKHISRVLKILEDGFSIENTKKIVSEKIDSIQILPDVSFPEGLNDVEASFMYIRQIFNIYETALTGFNSKEIISYEPENIRYGNMRYLNRMLSRSKDNAVLDKMQMLIYEIKFYLQCWQCANKSYFTSISLGPFLPVSIVLPLLLPLTISLPKLKLIPKLSGLSLALPHANFFGTYPDAKSCSKYKDRLKDGEVGLIRIKDLQNLEEFEDHFADCKMIAEILEHFKFECIEISGSGHNFMDEEIRLKMKDIRFKEYGIALTEWPLAEIFRLAKNC